MIRATLDVNVIFSGFSASGGAPAEVIAPWLRRQFVAVLSDHILTGAAAVWDRPYWRSRYAAAEASHALALMRSRAVLVAPAPGVRGIAADEEDDLIVATAAAGNAGDLITGDRALQAVGRYQNVTIVSPRQFLDLLDAERVRM